MLTANHMRWKVQLQSPSATPSGRGFIDTTWSTQATVRCAIENIESKEEHRADEDQLEYRLMFKIRYRSDVDETWRVVYDGENYEIIGRPVDPDHRKRELHILARLAR